MGKESGALPNEPIRWLSDEIARVVGERRFADLATIVDCPEGCGVEIGAKVLVEPGGVLHGSFGNPELDRAVAADAGALMAERQSHIAAYSLSSKASEATVEVFHEILEPQAQLLVIGAGHIAKPLAHFGKVVGFEVVVVDDRDKYANRERFPDADQVIAADFGPTLHDFPLTPATYVVIITRAHTYDEEALRIILDKPSAYIGMIGSRRRVQTVFRALAAEGYDRQKLAEIHAPIGLDIGSETPEEIALSVIAEVVTVRRGGSGVPLSKAIRPVAI